MLLALRSLWENQAPPLIPSASGVAVIYKLGMGYALDAPAGTIKMQNPMMLARLALRIGYARVDFE